MRKNRKITEKLLTIYHLLSERYGKIECPLNHKNTYELLVAVILSAQCTDKKVNDVTPALFKVYPTPAALADADQTELENIIRSIGLYRAKSANLIATAKKIMEDFGGKVPEEMEGLTSLKGVGRKTANVILGNAFDKPGFPVDTHVKRLLNRIGIVKSDYPEKIEEVVNTNLPPEYWTDFSHLLITHGRACCKARKPLCNECNLPCAQRRES